MTKAQMDEIKNIFKNLDSFLTFIDYDEYEQTPNPDDHLHKFKIDRENIDYPYILIDYGDTTLVRESNNCVPYASNSYFLLIEELQEVYTNNPFETFTNDVVNMVNDFFLNCVDLHILSIELIEGPVESKYKNKNTLSMIFKIDVGF